MRTNPILMAAALWIPGTLASAQAPAPTDGPAAAQVRTLMLDRLKDPLSAQIIVTKGPWTQEASVMGDHVNGQWYCAKINAKNAYGGYAGFTNYLLVDGPGKRDLAWEYQEGGFFGIDRAATKMCRPSAPPADLTK